MVAWSIMVASCALHLPITTPLSYLTLFSIGAFVKRGAGCTIDDMWGRNMDEGIGESISNPLIYTFGWLMFGFSVSWFLLAGGLDFGVRKED